MVPRIKQKYESDFSELEEKTLQDRLEIFRKSHENETKKVLQRKDEIMNLMNENIINLSKTENDKKIAENNYIEENNKCINKLNNDLKDLEQKYKMI